MKMFWVISQWKDNAMMPCVQEVQVTERGDDHFDVKTKDNLVFESVERKRFFTTREAAEDSLSQHSYYLPPPPPPIPFT